MTGRGRARRRRPGRAPRAARRAARRRSSTAPGAPLSAASPPNGGRASASASGPLRASHQVDVAPAGRDEHLVVGDAGLHEDAPAAGRLPHQPGGAHQQPERLLGGPVAGGEELLVDVEERDEPDRVAVAGPAVQGRLGADDDVGVDVGGRRRPRPRGPGLGGAARRGRRGGAARRGGRPAAAPDPHSVQTRGRLVSPRGQARPAAVSVIAAPHCSQRATCPHWRHTSSRARPRRFRTQTLRRPASMVARSASASRSPSRPRPGGSRRRSTTSRGGQPARAGPGRALRAGPQRDERLDGRRGGDDRDGRAGAPGAFEEDVAGVPGRGGLLDQGLVGVVEDDHRGEVRDRRERGGAPAEHDARAAARRAPRRGARRGGVVALDGDRGPAGGGDRGLEVVALAPVGGDDDGGALGGRGARRPAGRGRRPVG